MLRPHRKIRGDLLGLVGRKATLSFIHEILTGLLLWARDCVRGSRYNGGNRQSPALGELTVQQRTGHPAGDQGATDVPKEKHETGFQIKQQIPFLCGGINLS